MQIEIMFQLSINENLHCYDVTEKHKEILEQIREVSEYNIELGMYN